MSDRDPRLPILLRARFSADELTPADFLLLDAALAHPAPPVGVPARMVAFAADVGGHGAACACCVARSPVSRLLAHLVVERARGEVAFFARIVAVSDLAGRAALRAAVRADPLVAGRYRI